MGLVTLRSFCFQPELMIFRWIEYYNNHRSHEAVDDVTPSDKYFGKLEEILEHSKKTKNRKSIQINSENYS